MKNNNKIAIISPSLGVGGAERFSGLLSCMLHDLGYEVHTIIILDYVDYDFKGRLVNLGKIFKDGKGIFRGIRKGKFIANYLDHNKIEAIIDNRSRPVLLREIFAKWIYGNRKVYFMVHSSNIDMYFPRLPIIAGYLYKNAAKLICVSKGIEESVRQKYHLNNTATIYNPIFFPESFAEKPKGLPQRYILYFGRLEEKIKNLSLLLRAFSVSGIYQNGVRLLVIGDGKDKDSIVSKTNELGLSEFVQFLPFQKNIIPYIQHAQCSVLTSRFEGFPMSIVESLAAGTPVISVDCKTGPNEIIQNKYNGLLVPNHDEKALGKAIADMVSDENLHQTCKNNAQKSVEHLSLTNIAHQWQQLLAEK